MLFIGGKIKTNNGKEKNLNKLNIAYDENFYNFYNFYQGQFPVIHLNLKTVELKFKEDELNFSDYEDQLRFVISNSYKEHEYLMSWIEKQEINLYGNLRINKFKAYLY